MNTVLTCTTTINGLAFLSGAVSFGGAITGVDVADVADFQSALDLKAPKDSPAFTGTVLGISKSMVGLGNVDNTSDKDKPLSDTTLGMFTTIAGHLIYEMIAKQTN